MSAGNTNHFLAGNQVVWASAPANYTGATATTEWINLGKFKRLTFIIQTGAWAAGTAAVTLDESPLATGVGTQDLALAYMYTNSAAATSMIPVKTTVTSNTFNVSVANSLYMIEVDAAELSQGFPFVSCAIASPGANNDYYGLIVIASEPRNPAAPGKMEDAVV